ncbi:MAG: XdhC family protein [Chloroflexota bacterium]|nr:XdhC family protein [Chloroflexota bacterium]
MTRAGSLLERAVELDRAGRPYALATVVAVRRPTSARPGARGLIHPDGAIEGFVGGSCARPLVVREALRALADGQPRLLRISREPPSESRRADGIVDEVMTCHSGGTLEIYVEPHLPAPSLWIAGTTPIAAALAELGAAVGFDVTVMDPVAEPSGLPDGVRVVVGDDLGNLPSPPAGPYVVVASQGVWDEEAIASALRLDVAYIGLVASPTRAAAVRTWLLDEGIAPERVLAVRAPAGMDLGAESPAEVAVSILAELVQVRRGRAAFVAAPGPAILAGAATTASEPIPALGDIVLLDPVCGMTVDRADARHLAEHGGVVYAFCSIGCRSRFVREPTAYVGSGASTGG